MKFTLAILLTLSFVAIAVFGVFAMGHEGGHGCIAAAAQGSDCPENGNGLPSAAFHLDSFKNFSSATFGQKPGIMLLPVFLLLFCLAAAPRIRRAFISGRYFAHQACEVSASPLRRALIRWFALHEESPAVL